MLPKETCSINVMMETQLCSSWDFWTFGVNLLKKKKKKALFLRGWWTVCDVWDVRAIQHVSKRVQRYAADRRTEMCLSHLHIRAQPWHSHCIDWNPPVTTEHHFYTRCSYKYKIKVTRKTWTSTLCLWVSRGAFHVTRRAFFKYCDENKSLTVGHFF